MSVANRESVSNVFQPVLRLTEKTQRHGGSLIVHRWIFTHLKGPSITVKKKSIEILWPDREIIGSVTSHLR